MATTVIEISRWLERGVSKGATHVVVGCDMFDWTDYPIYVMPGEDVQKPVQDLRDGSLSKLMEVYWLGGDIPEQLSRDRCHEYGPTCSCGKYAGDLVNEINVPACSKWPACTSV
jgi:hypothetical protein